MDKGKIYKFCLIGAGRMGARWAEIINENPRARLELVIDANESTAKTVGQKFNCAYGQNIPEDFGNNGCDAVLVATPHNFLFSSSLACLRAGKHVLAEKPGAITSGDLETLRETAEKNKLSLMVGFNYRFFESISRAKKIIDAGKIGDIMFIRLRHGQAARPDYDKEWRMNKEISGGGVLMDHGTHNIDLVNYFLSGKKLLIGGATANLFWQTDAEDNAFVLLKNDGGQLASLHMGITEWKPLFSLEIFGKNGYCAVNGLGKKYGGSEILKVGLKDSNGQIAEEEIVCNPEVKNSFQAELNEFIDSIEQGRLPSPNAEDAIKTLKIIEEVYAGAKTNK